MAATLKCPRCNNSYEPTPEDFSHPTVKSGDSRQIFLRRYGHSANGRHIECLICLDTAICGAINFVQFSLLKGIPSLFGLPISPYKPFMNPITFSDMHMKANRIHDITKKDIPSILNDELLIPPHIFDFLLDIKLFSLGDLGLKYKGKYCHVYPAGNGQVTETKIAHPGRTWIPAGAVGVSGRQLSMVDSCTLADIMEPLPMLWSEQRVRLGFLERE